MAVQFIITVAERCVLYPDAGIFPFDHGQIGNAMSVNSFVTTVGFFRLFILPINYRADTPCHSHSLDRITGCLFDDNAGVLGHPLCWALFGVTCDMMNWPVLLKSEVDWAIANNKVGCLASSKQGWHCRYRGGIFCVGSIYLVWHGLLGFKAGIWFYSLIVIAVALLFSLS